MEYISEVIGVGDIIISGVLEASEAVIIISVVLMLVVFSDVLR